MKSGPAVLVAALVLLAAFAAVMLQQVGLALFLAVIGAAVALAPLIGRRSGAASVSAPVAVPPEEVELEEGPVTCCMRCGSIHVRQPSLSEGHIPGAGASFAWICARCRFRGPPLEFESATAYRQFVKGLNEKPSEAEDSA